MTKLQRFLLMMALIGIVVVPCLIYMETASPGAYEALGVIADLVMTYFGIRWVYHTYA
jgi:hypothetical protein